MREVAVTGLSGICALGGSLQALWKGLCTGCAQPTLPEILSQGVAALPYPSFLIPFEEYGFKRHFSAQDSLTLARYCATNALAMAGLRSLKGVQAGTVWGTTSGSALHFLAGYQKIRAGGSPDSADIAAYKMCNLALVLGREMDAQGPWLTISNACTSGADALALGFDLIGTGRCSLVVCGGADALSLVPHTGFARLMVYDEQRARPFDRTRKGLNLGEGAACLVLEDAEHAQKRQAPIYGYLRGYGQQLDAYHLTAPHPEGFGLRVAVEKALTNAGLKAEEIAFINAHGTGTIENDRVEGQTLLKVFENVPIWASKAVTGHTLGAAGALEALFSLLALHKHKIPQSFGFMEVDAEINVVPTQSMQACTQKMALSTSLAFGGFNTALVLEGEAE